MNSTVPMVKVILETMVSTGQYFAFNKVLRKREMGSIFIMSYGSYINKLFFYFKYQITRYCLCTEKIKRSNTLFIIYVSLLKDD